MAAIVVQLLRKDELNSRTYLQAFLYQLKQASEQLTESREANQLLQSHVSQLQQGQFDLMQRATELLTENLDLRARVDVLERENAELRGEGPNEVTPAESEARAELIKQSGELISKVVPEAWQMFKMHQFKQAAQAAAKATGNGQTNGHNGHAAE